MVGYEKLTSLLKRKAFDVSPYVGLIVDEAHKCKSPKANRSKAVQTVADQMGYVVCMSGTPSPKTPLDWWQVCEIAAPGFLREGSRDELLKTLANVREVDYGHGPILEIESWQEDQIKRLHDRLAGLVEIVRKDDCLDLPEKIYRPIELEPEPDILEAARAIVAVAPSTIEGLTRLRELSDGFQYRQSEKGRETIQIPCPKEAALVDLLDECNPTGRVVIFAGFTGSLDRIDDVCERCGWQVVRCDGRGLRCPDPNTPPLDYWADFPGRVAFVANPESGGVSFTLVESHMIVFYSNTFKPEYREQAENRIHRPGQTRGCQLVDLLYLPSDRKVLERVREGRKLELMTLGDFTN
jgi:SNF2 family DNA or RNA helicase